MRYRSALTRLGIVAGLALAGSAAHASAALHTGAATLIQPFIAVAPSDHRHNASARLENGADASVIASALPRSHPQPHPQPRADGVPTALAVTDDSGRDVVLARPARRIVSLAPHATELLFAAGAGAAVIGVTDYSDFPPAAKSIPSLGNAANFDVERIASLKPDLVVAWASGNPSSKLAALRSLGIAVFESEPRQFDTIATSLQRLGRLAGTSASAEAAARAFRLRLNDLQSAFRDRPPVPVFYQIWRSPLMTLNGSHLVSQAIALCGGVNIFASLGPLAPTVSIESVLTADPEAIVTGAEGREGRESPLTEWRRFSALKAVRHNNLFALSSDNLTRSGPRLLDGTETLCQLLEQARGRRR